MFEQHRHCPCRVVILGRKPHYAKLHCIKHNKMVQWLSKEDALEYKRQQMRKLLKIDKMHK
jgi:hypothetical protein